MNELALHLLQLLYFMAPAYLANMASPLASRWTGWNRPIHARLLGSHKTVVGSASCVVVGVLVTALQAWIDAPIDLVDYSRWPWLGLGFGVGATAGDVLKSLVKRRLRIAPGAPWIPFDQIDFALGALVLVGPAAGLSGIDVLLILIATFAGDLAVNRLAFRLGIKDTPW